MPARATIRRPEVGSCAHARPDITESGVAISTRARASLVSTVQPAETSPIPRTPATV